MTNISADAVEAPDRDITATAIAPKRPLIGGHSTSSGSPFPSRDFLVATFEVKSLISIPTLLSGSEMMLAISHPLRRRMLRVLVDAGEPLSLDRLTREFELPIGTARYHANVLCGFGAAEPTRPDTDDGGEYLYDATIDGDPEVEALLEETREGDEAAMRGREDG
jgi:DNA-binding transcriptional ArsR family regulator